MSQTRKAVTLLEVLIVITILGLAAGIMVPAARSMIFATENAKVKLGETTPAADGVIQFHTLKIDDAVRFNDEVLGRKDAIGTFKGWRLYGGEFNFGDNEGYTDTVSYQDLIRVRSKSIIVRFKYSDDYEKVLADIKEKNKPPPAQAG